MDPQSIDEESYISFRQLFLPFRGKDFDRLVSGMGRCPICGWAPLGVKPNQPQFCYGCKSYVTVSDINSSTVPKKH